MEDANEIHSSDSDIIPETPPMKAQKKTRKLAKLKPHPKSSHHYEDYFLHRKCVPDEKLQIAMTCSGSADFNKPYVYRTIDEILEINDKGSPKNNNIHLVGVHKFSDHLGHYLANKVSVRNGDAFVQLDCSIGKKLQGWLRGTRRI
ncbi:hypothetical protein JTB14_013798 [Gonioctena quinquepunctata]|nr:hypothetical protein JTB14_013798 [Gonioctena quinquepunctata]